MQHLRRYRCFVKREGTRHTLVQNAINGVRETVPRHIDRETRNERRKAKEEKQRAKTRKWKIGKAEC